ncbi:hypothetical protein KY290_030948 [Solanum tuberosum]|uniref:Uncharacterized protein n=1 Tax=Solanum tuberosum TaxID=4113 RepID=A0ABQ7UB92_SOLTU|nr:hypothetical protein KY285_031715 [Solanum tuberosum]KAH0742955.1 hypothetical protein KY290_030948 [Solanum tuberosum]
MHNDIAKSELNPRPGVIINHLNGSGVYVACLRWGCQVHWTHFLDSLMEQNSQDPSISDEAGHYALYFLIGLGVKGAALANSISYWLNFLFLAIYIKFSPTCAKTWTGLSKEALKDMLAFIGLAIPSAIMVCLEMWSFELIVLLSGLLPNPQLETSVLSIWF